MMMMTMLRTEINLLSFSIMINRTAEVVMWKRAVISTLSVNRSTEVSRVEWLFISYIDWF
jgi:hypothetical protein